MTATEGASRTSEPAEGPASPAPGSAGPASLPDDPDLRRFAAELGGLWSHVSAWTSPLDEAASRGLYDLMAGGRRQNVAAGLAVSSVSAHAGDLSALRAGWPHFTPGQKAVLNAAAAFLLETDRSRAAVAEGNEAALVVTAAVRALLHRR